MGTWSVSPNEGVTGSGPSFTFPGNTASNRKKYTVTYSVDSEETCSKDIYVAGTGSPVDCCSQYGIVGIVPYIIPSNGITNGHEPVAVVKSYNTDSCPMSNLTAVSSTISGLEIGQWRDEYYVYITDCDPVGQSTVKTHVITLASDGEPCSAKSFEVIQEGEEEKCSCESVDYWISVLNGKVNNSSHDNLLIASGDTHGCGVISASTDSEMLDGGNVRCSYSSDNSIVRIYADVLANTSGVQRSCGIKLFFRKMTPGGTYDECVDKDIYLVQSDNVPSCDNINCSSLRDEVTVAGTSGNLFYIFNVPSSGYSDYAVAYEFLEGGEYVDHVRLRFGTNDTLYVDVYYKENSTPSSRIIKTKFTPYIGVTWDGDTWSGGQPCTDKACVKIITQESGGGCECSQASLSIRGDNPKLITDLSEHTEVIGLDFFCGDMTSLPIGWSITVKSFEPQTFITRVGAPYEVMGHYASLINIAANPQGETRNGTIVFCLNDDKGECKCISAITKQEIELCDSCETFKDKIEDWSTTTLNGRYRNNHKLFLFEYLKDKCWTSLSASYCDSSGNIISGYDWLSNLRVENLNDVIADIAENDTNSSRVAYFAIEGLKPDGTPIFSDCKAIAKLTQTPMLECNCTNVTSDVSITVTAETSSSNPVNTGVTNVYVGRVRYSINNPVKTDCVEVIAETTQTDCIGNINAQTTITVGESLTYIYTNIYCDTYDSQAIPEEGLPVTIDVHLECGTEVCTAGAAIITLYIKRQ